MNWKTNIHGKEGNNMRIELTELINGFVLQIYDDYEIVNEFHETKRSALSAIERYINKAQIHELNLIIEGSRYEC